MTQTCKKFAVIKPSMWMIFHTVQFMITSNLERKLHTLIIGELRDLRKNKGSRKLTAVTGDTGQWCETECFKSCVFTVYVRELGLDTRYSKVTASLLPQLTLLAKTTIT